MSEVTSTIEMFVEGLVLDSTTQTPVVLLRSDDSSTHIPIWIGPTEATAIAIALQGIEMPRPLTHDLMFSVFNELGVKLDKVIITSLQESTYIAEMVLTKGDKTFIIDSRPSDAIAFALRASTPIFVATEVVEQAKVVPKIIDSDETEEQQVDDLVRDFQQVDKKDWTEVLEKLTPEDFKFKM